MGFLPTMSIVATETQYPGIKPAQDRMRLPTPKLYSLPLTMKMGSILLINISSTCVPNCTENDRGVQSKSVLPVSSATVGDIQMQYRGRTMTLLYQEGPCRSSIDQNVE